MPIEITMPRLSDTMEEGTLIKWRVKAGDNVKSGDVLADVETDKATMELQSYDDGTVAKLAVEEGQTAPVGKLILLLAEVGESVDDALKGVGGGQSAAAASSSASKAQAGTSAVAGGSGPGDSPNATSTATATSGGAGGSGATGGSGRVRVSPVARKMAEEHGLDPATITGSGPDGRVIKRDILAAAQGTAAPGSPAAPAPAKPLKPVVVQAPPTSLPVGESKTISLSNMRKTIARRLVESKTTIPHFTVTVAVDMDPLMEMRTSLNAYLESQGTKLSVNDFIVRGSAMALQRHPMVNSSWTDAGIQQHGAISVGVAIALPADKGGGLVVATIRDTLNKSLRQISTETRTLAKKARTQGLSLEEMSDGTFTISNLGMFGVEHFEAIINPPQAAILAVGAANEKPVARDGKVTLGHEMTATLSADHRIIDGAMAAEFLVTLKQLLENPAVMMV